MGHNVIPEISKKSNWHIPKYRFLELKYFCLQYPSWKREVADLLASYPNFNPENPSTKSNPEFIDKTSDIAIRISNLNSKISLVGKIAKMSDESIADYIIKGVTEGVSFVRLKTYYEIPCERDMYYDRFRKFFWVLDKVRDKSQMFQLL